MKPRIILASSSKYRRELMDRLAVEYSCESPDVDESSLPGESAVDAALRLSKEKADAVWKRHPGSIVIGSDQVAVLDGRRIGKPGTREKSIQQLSEMSGKVVSFHTALTVIDAQGRAETVDSVTTVRMRSLSREAIEAYVDIEEPFDCAGSAKIEKLGIALMDSVESDDPTSLIGLPLMKLTTLLAKAGASPLPGLE